MKKLKLKLPPDEMRALALLIGALITSVDVKELKSNRKVDYLLFACVSEMVDRMLKKATDFARWNTVKFLASGEVKKPILSVPLHRHEAIALFFLLTEDVDETNISPLLVVTIRAVIDEINQMYMI